MPLDLPPLPRLLATRRQLLQATAALGAGAALGALGSRRARAAVSPGERRFLFVFASGGWDVSYALSPLFEKDAVAPVEGGERAEAHGLTFVDHERSPTVASFFEEHGASCSLVHGYEVRSITHDNCRRISFTGSPGVGADGWPAILAGHAPEGTLLPGVVISGPSYAAAHTASVVRVGRSGQLGALLDGSAREQTERLAGRADTAHHAAAARFLAARAEALAASADPGQAAELAESWRSALERAEALGELAGELDLESTGSLDERLAMATSLLAGGHSRSVVVQDDGWFDLTWDSHGENSVQSRHFESLFLSLDALVRDLDGRPGPAGGTLLDETLVVVLSEMGRHPQLTSTGGKDHWTWTSALLVGGSLEHGLTVGDYDDQVFGRPVDLATGEPDEGGRTLTAAHLGATLLALGDVDPGPYVDAEVSPITAITG